MDYKKAYENALKRAKDCHVNKKFSELDDNAQQLCEYIFPELKMSEDEKIKRGIIKFLKENKDFPEDWIAWLENQGKTFTKRDVDDAYLKGICDAKRELEKQGENNSTDSYCEEHCKGFQETGKCFADGDCKAKKEAEQKPAWSGEDELMFTSTINSLKLINGACDIKIEWLKSLKDRVQPHWKPTDEQMQSLYFAIITYSKKDDCKLTYDGLNSLYDDLKKL